MWISRTSLVLALLASCNWVYGLDATTIGIDTDEDGVIDALDNCPTISNPDQLDSNAIDVGGDACAQCPNILGVDLDDDAYDDGCDRCLGPGPAGIDVDQDGLDDGCDPCVAGASQFAIDFNGNGIGDGCEVCFEPARGDDDQDGLDDACDTCALGPPHDEDGDGIDDACDNCPLDPNPDQAKRPTETYGEACDRATAAKVTRTFFDPFLVRDIFHWTGVFGAWSQIPDRSVVTMFGSRTITASFTGEFRFVVRARLTAVDSVVAVQQTSTMTGTRQGCSVTRAGEVMFGGMTTTISLTDEPITIELYQSETDLAGVTRCVVYSGSQNVGLSGVRMSETTRIVLEALSSELYAVDLIAGLPKAETN